MIVSIVVKNTTGIPADVWKAFVDEMCDSIADHSLEIQSIGYDDPWGPGHVTWRADFLEIPDDIACAKSALQEIVAKVGAEYSWLGASDAAEANCGE